MKSPTGRLVAGLVFTLLVIGAYATFTLRSVNRMRDAQTGIVERNRLGSLQLIRIQSELSYLAMAMRDMLDEEGAYPLSAWRPALGRARRNLEDALRREAELSQGNRSEQQTAFLNASFTDFWRACDRMLDLADAGKRDQAREMVRATLQSRQEALTALTARLLVENSEQESLAGREVSAFYSEIERNAYVFLGVSVALIAITSLGLIRANRRLFARMERLSEDRRELAQQLISTQESTLRSISRDLHDEFGQILTALGAMLRRAKRHAPSSEFQAQVQEAMEVVQGTLEKIRSLSQSLQPVILEEQGLLAAVDWHLSGFERLTGIAVRYSRPDSSVGIPPATAIHVFRILQEALNNVARHAGVSEVKVALDCKGGRLRLEVEDRGRGISEVSGTGIGLAAMRERAELVKGQLSILRTEGGGTRVVFELPLETSDEVAIG